jgi:glycosyltransferase involved in cell wall biosynthesis
VPGSESAQVGESDDRVYVFLCRLSLGGIETLLLKAMDELSQRGRTVLLAGDEGELSYLLNPAVREIRDLSPRPIADAIDPATKEVVIVSMHTWALVHAALLNRELARRGHAVRGFHLVTHSRAYFFESRVPVLNRLLRRAFFSSPPASTYFMNLAALRSHETYWQTDLSKYPVLKLPLTPPAAEWKPSRRKGLKVVSVGRLVPFKGYNRAAPAVVQSLRGAGIDVTWDIWGDGTDQANVENAIADAGIGQYVRLKGVLPYEAFDRTVAGYDLFVGMGTALLEAGQLGMPAVTAVEASTDQTYGFLFDTPLDSVGDVVAGAPTRSLEDMVRSFADLGPNEAAAIGRRCRDSAAERSSTTGQVADMIENAESWRLGRSDRLWLNVAAVVIELKRLRYIWASRQ